MSKKVKIKIIKLYDKIFYALFSINFSKYAYAPFRI